MARAVQIERRLSKAEILDLYLDLAPYGGNLEGVRAASLAYFGKEPKRLSRLRSRSARRPAATARTAPRRTATPRRPKRRANGCSPAWPSSTVIGEGEADARPRKPSRPAACTAGARAPMPAERRAAQRPGRQRHQTHDPPRRAAGAGSSCAQAPPTRLGAKLSVAMVMADARTGEILGEVGSADYFDASRSGWIDA